MWAEDAVRQCAAWSKAARRLVGHEMLHDYYRDELGYGRNRVERIELDAKGKLLRLVFTFRRSYAAVTVNFVDEQADDRALVLAALVEAWVLLPEQVVPFVQEEWRPASGYSDDLRSALDSIGNQVDLHSLVLSTDPVDALRYVADGMEARNNPGHAELHRFVDALKRYY